MSHGDVSYYLIKAFFIPDRWSPVKRKMNGNSKTFLKIMV